MNEAALKHVIALLLEDARRVQQLEPNAGTEARIWIATEALSEIKTEDLIMLNGQLCNKDAANMVIEKLLPTFLEVISEKLKSHCDADEVEKAAKTVINAALESIILRSQVSPRS